MRKVYVSIYDCNPGMEMGETIFNEYGAVVVAEGTILDPHIIRKLSNLGVSKIRIIEHEQNIVTANSSELFKAQYNENVEAVKGILHDISTGRDLNVEKVNMVSGSIFERINENRDIVGCLNQIRSVDEYTYAHSINVSLLSMLIGKWMKMEPERIKLLVQSGLLHDIGKTKIPSELISKPGPLTDEEFGEIKKHPIYGYRILEPTDVDRDVCMGVLMHHEREDGTGYPIGLQGTQIHEFGKILAVADIYDAMTSDRAYRVRESPFEVFELMENRTFGYLDPTVVNVFLNHIAAYYIGDMVQLNTGQIGEIIYINPRYICRPLVKVGNTYVDLSRDLKVKITQLI